MSRGTFRLFTFIFAHKSQFHSKRPTNKHNSAKTMILNLFNRKAHHRVQPEHSGGLKKKQPPKSHHIDSTSMILGAAVSKGGSKCRVKLGIEKNLFSRTGDSVPVFCLSSGEPFNGIEIRGKLFESGDVVFQDAVAKVPIAVVERKYTTSGNVFKIYSARQVDSGQKPVNISKYNKRLYAFAEVRRHQGKVLGVTFEGRPDPSYTIHTTASHSSQSLGTRQIIIRKQGKEVASTFYDHRGNSQMLTLNAGTDPVLMICLAAVADEVISK